MADYGVYADEVDIVFDQQAHRSKNLNEMQRQAIYAALLERSSNGEKKILPKLLLKCSMSVGGLCNVFGEE